MKINDIPSVSRDQMIEIDQLMINEYDITLLQMMENAGRHLAELTRTILEKEFLTAKILISSGGGNNGGGGMVAARHLQNWGADVTLALSLPMQSLKEVPKQQLNSLEKMEVNIITDFPDESYDLIIDALIGYGLTGAPRGKVAEWIHWINQQDSRCVALDIPSGLDADSGQAPGNCIIADATLTLALPKIGMMKRTAKQYIGDLYVADISVPKNLLKRFFEEIPEIFSMESIIKLN